MPLIFSHQFHGFGELEGFIACPEASAVWLVQGATIHTSDGLYMNVSPRSMPELMKKADEADRPALKIPQEAVKVA